ncbi:MAG TPA: 23S rRNA (guanosine(2251)-2'-O)-methyltransferase RlmB [Bacteroidota bacterium]|nr:23S rRNA (guanosine(2251)-2'-O)-methyltransferase RlmB [Bacteroidota bacterium]
MNIIAGRKPVIEALNAGTLIEKIYILRGTHGEPIDAIRRLARQRNILCTDADRHVFDKLSSDVHSQGVIAITGVKEYTEVDEILSIASSSGEKPFLLIFDEIEDPHNLGALIRTAFCLGVHGGILPKHNASPVNETVAKTSAGASAHFPVAKVTNIVSAIEELKKSGVWVVGADANAQKSFAEVDYTMPIAIVVGNEGKGIRRLVKEKCDFLVSIPMARSFDSLNVSVAGALMMYEVYRKRSKR